MHKIGQFFYIVVYLCGIVESKWFIDAHTYALWNRQTLRGLERSISFSFVYCNDQGGLLLYTEGGEDFFFAAGIVAGM